MKSTHMTELNRARQMLDVTCENLMRQASDTLGKSLARAIKAVVEVEVTMEVERRMADLDRLAKRKREVKTKPSLE